MADQDNCGSRLLAQAQELRARLKRLLDRGSPQSAAEIEALRAKLGELEGRLRELARPGGRLDDLRQGAGKALEELKAAWRKASSRSR